VEARDVSVRYGARTALARTHLALHAGAMTVIVGPNGAGKTTLMRVLTGELTPDTGAVLLDGQDLVRLSPAALAGRRAVLPQATRL
ncbi:MAG: ATP-binding cassette domain-containing protein, partial [Alphaproteobacteria bacterium]